MSSRLLWGHTTQTDFRWYCSCIPRSHDEYQDVSSFRLLLLTQHSYIYRRLFRERQRAPVSVSESLNLEAKQCRCDRAIKYFWATEQLMLHRLCSGLQHYARSSLLLLCILPGRRPLWLWVKRRSRAARPTAVCTLCSSQNRPPAVLSILGCSLSLLSLRLFCPWVRVRVISSKVEYCTWEQVARLLAQANESSSSTVCVFIFIL